ncbi:IclR family transcriptional regulator [Haliea sp. E17]|uniref:IclR family transcriptional regulator n=1 Tax=Haliea sp. E17 TaxID=3401576 RepID=UPI003AADD652
MQVKQIANLFRLMEYFAEVGRPLSVREIVEAMGWPRSSVFNIVATMVDEGYLYQPAARGGYYPTTRWMDLARVVADSQPLPPSLHELLEDLAHATGETACLAAAEGSSVVFLDVVESSADIRFIANIGQRLPIHVASAGKAILAQYSPEELRAILGRIDYQHYEEQSFMSAEEVQADLQAQAAQGWYLNLGMFAPGVAGIAVPFAYGGRRYSIALGGPVTRIEGRADVLGKLLRERVRDFLNSTAA